MKKVFVMTPMEITERVTSEIINTYIRKASGAAESIIGEEIEVETNFFLETIGTDKDGEPIMQVRNADDELAYIAEELSAMEKCDYIVIPMDTCSNPGYRALWPASLALFKEGYIRNDERTVLPLPIKLGESRKRVSIGNYTRPVHY